MTPKESSGETVDDINSLFAESTVFITGVTGFLGHVLLFKLLKSCQNIRKIYILMRDKKNKDVNERFQQLLDSPIFTLLNAEQPDCLDKVTTIRGDCLKANLGLSENDRDLLVNEVNVIFHVAATVRFDAPLREAVNINVRSTYDLLEMAKNMKNLRAFVHVSTTYSFCAERTIIEEKIYEPPMEATNLIAVVDNLNDTFIDKITPTLLGAHPNTYVFTKAVAEGLFIRYESFDLPTCIFRPGIVIGTVKEPLPGWVNNMYGPTGITAAVGLGLLRTVHADGNKKSNVVPCDYVINAMIAAAWHTFKSRTNGCVNIDSVTTQVRTEPILVFNYSSTEVRNALTWKQYMDRNEKLERACPFSFAIWVYCFTLNRYKTVHQIYTIFLHLLPALIADKVAVLCGKKPKLWESYAKIHKLSNVLSYFATRQWTIPNENVRKLWISLNNNDRKIFEFDLDELNLEEYFRHHLAGIRQYIVKDRPDTIPEAIKRRKRLLLTHYTVISTLVCLLCYTLYHLITIFL